MRLGAVLLTLVASPALAELTATQQAVVDRLLPEFMQALDGKEASATVLVQCVAETGSRRETRQMAEAEDLRDAVTLANDIMTRPELMGCLTEKLVQ